MNISENEFANKSADQIVKDVLEQHKQNAKDALAYIQNITTDDGLSLSKETKAQLKKAEDMLVNRVKRESMTEGIWPFKKKEPEPQRYPAKLLCFPPFKKEPTEVMLPPIASVDDPIVDHYVKLIRAKHPHSPISLRSEAGWKTFYENSIHDYTVKACNKNGKITESKVGNLPIAMALSEKLYESGIYSEINVLKEDKPVSTLSKKDGWNISKLPEPKKITKKSDNFLTKTGKDIVNSKTVNDLATAGLSAITGITPPFLTGVTNVFKNYAKDKINAHNKYKQGLADINARYGIKEEDTDITTDDVYEKDFIQADKSILDITKRFLYELVGIHPGLNDTRGPKIQWPEALIQSCPTLQPSDPDKYIFIPQRYFVIRNIIPANPNIPEGNDLYQTLRNIAEDPEAIEQFKQEYLSPDETTIVLYPKYPSEELGTSNRTGAPIYAWKIDEKHPIRLSASDVLYMLDSPENIEAMDKLIEKQGDIEECFRRDLSAADYLKNDFNKWVDQNNEKLGLDRFNSIEKGKLFQKWKDAQTDTLIHTKRDLAPEEVDEFYYNQLRDKLSLVPNSKEEKIFNMIKNSINKLNNYPFKKEQFEDLLNTKLLSKMTDNPKQNGEILIQTWNDSLAEFNAENLLNQASNGNLFKQEEILKYNNSPSLSEFLNSVSELAEKCLTTERSSFKGIKVPNLEFLRDNIRTLKNELNALIAKYKDDQEVNAFKRNKMAKVDPNTEVLAQANELIDKYSVGNPDVDKEHPVIKALKAVIKMTGADNDRSRSKKRINKQANDNSDLAASTAYVQKTIDYIKELEKSGEDMASEKVASVLKSLVDKIKVDTTNYDYSLNKRLDKTYQDAFADFLNS